MRRAQILILPIQLFCIAVAPTLARAAIPAISSAEVLGATFNLLSPEDSRSRLERTINDSEKIYTEALDPSCRYRTPGPTGCAIGEGARSKSASLQSLLTQLKSETQGLFDVVNKSDSNPDYAEIAQGVMLEEIAREFKGPWAGEFAGDVFASDSEVSGLRLGIANPIFPEVLYSYVDMKSGWMFTSSVAKFGAAPRDPRTGQPVTNSDFSRIVLFGKPSMNGVRLDAWAAALIVGGKSLLQKLWGLPDYSGRWGFLYFTPQWKVACSPNLRCDFLDKRNRRIKVPW